MILMFFQKKKVKRKPTRLPLVLTGIKMISQQTILRMRIFHHLWVGCIKTKTLFFNSGKVATDGIEQMAETGATKVLVEELNAEVSAEKGLKVYTGSGLGSGVGSITLDVQVSTLFPSVSLVTMLAPSPDWYVACVDVNLLNEDNELVANKTVVGRVYDAGTDNGATFTSSDSDTNPKTAISRITQPPLGDGTEVKPSFCTITFEKK